MHMHMSILQLAAVAGGACQHTHAAGRCGRQPPTGSPCGSFVYFLQPA